MKLRLILFAAALAVIGVVGYHHLGSESNRGSSVAGDSPADRASNAVVESAGSLAANPSGPTVKIAQAQAKPSESPLAGDVQGGGPGAAGRAKRAWDYGFLAGLSSQSEGQSVRFELVGGQTASGIIRKMERRDGELISVWGDVERPESGRFFFQKQTLPGKAGDFVGLVTFPASKQAYRIEPTGPNGKSELVERQLEEVMCLAMPAMDAALAGAQAEEMVPPLDPQDQAGYVPGYNDGIIALQSLPGATAVLYIDYRGGYTPTWGGITYAKPSVSNAQIKDVWKRVAEDYMPFNVNVTTDISVYEAAPENSRQRCICTPTTTAAPGAGGVAYLNSWNWTGDTPCWSFYSAGKSAAEVISHEVGHTLTLGHDGRTSPYNEGYYGGQGSGVTGWAPIMGVGYYQPVAQWSKGEYAYANNTEDDLARIVGNNNSVDYRADDTGGTLTTSRHLEIYTNYTVFAEGVIETTGDTDAFQFTTIGGAISLSVTPVGDWADLAAMATLADSTDTLIASNNPQNVLSASIATNLPAGTYTFRVTGAGRNDPASDGFSSYASLGYYSVSGSVAGGRLPTRLTVVERAANGTVVGTVPAGNTNGTLACAILSGNTGGTFSIDAGGVVRVANNTLLDYFRLATNTLYDVRFEMFVNITNLTYPEQTELNRRVLVNVLNVNDAPVVVGFTNTVIEHTLAGTVVGTVQTSDADWFDWPTFSIVSGNTNGAFAIDAASGAVTVTGDIQYAAQSAYALAIGVNDNAAGNPIISTGYVTINIVTNFTPFQPGSISYALYDGIGSGVYVTNLTYISRFPTDPTSEKQMSNAEGDTGRGDNYGSVLRGYLIPPASGAYTFFIASDDNSELRFSTTTNPASAAAIANVNGASSWTDPRQWNKFTSQKSGAYSLTAGQGYYLEARQKEGGGGDNLAVGWSGPATSGKTNVISGLYLAPYRVNYVPHPSGFTNYVRRDAITGAKLGRMAVTDVNTNDDHAFAITAGNSAGIFGVDSNGWVYVASDTALAAASATNFTLSIRTTDNGTPALSATNTVKLNLVEPGVIAATQLQREMFYNIGSGTAVADLTGNAKYPGRPDDLSALSSFASPSGVADSYGSRIRALLVPSVSGDYRFFIAADDNAQLKFSMTTNPVSATVIASVSSGAGWADVNEWTKLPEQTSALITGLVGGQAYYIEALQKEGGGGDHVEVGWVVPGSGVTNVIPGANLQPVDINSAPQISGQSWGVMQNAANGASIGTATATDSAMETLTFKIVGGNTGGTFALDSASGNLTVANNALIASGGVPSFSLQIAVQDSGYSGLYPLRSATNTFTVGVISTNGLFWDANLATTGAQDGSGAWVASGSNWWNGAANTLWADTNNALFGFSTTTNCTVTIANDVTPTGITFNSTGGGSYTLAGGGGINLSGTPAFAAYADASISALLKGAGSLTKTGSGKLTLSAINTFTGGTTVNAGTLALAAGGTSGAIRGAVTVNSGAMLKLDAGDGLGYNADTTVVQTLNLNGGTLNCNAGANQTTTADIILTGGSIIGTNNLDLFSPTAANNNASITTLAATNPATISVATMNLRQNDVTFNVAAGSASPDLLVSTPLGNGTGTSSHNFIKTGSGRMVLSGNNVYTGNTIISNGVFELASGGKLYNSAWNNTAVITINAGGTWRLPDFSYGGVGQLADYAGRRVLNGGTIEVTGGTHSSGQDFTVNAATGGIFRYTPAVTTNILSLAGNANTDIQVNGPLTFDAAGNITITEVVAGAGTITKTGGGTLTLAATNTYTGWTVVSNGTLLVNVSIGTNTVTVATNGTLGGVGLIRGATTVQNGGVLAPGANAIGTLTVSNNVIFAVGSRAIMEISRNGGVPTNDVLFISGSFAQNGSLVVTNIGTNNLGLGDSFKLFAAGAYSGNFTNLTLPALAGGLTWKTNTLATNGTLTVAASTYTLTYLANANGTISGTSPQTVNNGATGTAVTAVPNPGYFFVNWSDGATANPRTDVTVTNNITVMANFAQFVTPVASAPVRDAGGYSFTFTGSSGQPYTVLETTNASLPMSSWETNQVGVFGAGGVAGFTNATPTDPIRFYRIRSP